MIEREKRFAPAERFTEEDIILITYGDLIREDGRSPLAVLAEFCERHLPQTINTLHILPFFPYSSDRGFAIIDFEEVDPSLGGWSDIEALEGRFQLMFDGVVNHVSSKSRWFQEFLNGQSYYGDFFIAYDSPDDLPPEQKAQIFRPRTSDILTQYYTLNGPRFVWTTFSSDQIDLNYKNPEVLLRVLEVLLLYVRRGADIIRLDAVTYLWCEPGTTCIHLEETHEIIKLFRDVLDEAAPAAALITETNVPHEENISYFGGGNDEAQMVYNFALPPLVLHTFYAGDATDLSRWAQSLENPSDTATFFNFLDSHDGVGLMAVQNILTAGQIDALVQRAEKHGGLVSYKTGPHGAEVPYEINVTWFSALNRENSDEGLDLQVKRFIASRAVSFVLPGVPGVYLHSLVGSSNDLEAVKNTGSKRAINRTVLDGRILGPVLDDPASKPGRISRALENLGRARTTRRAFHPNGPMRVLDLEPGVFSALRTSPEETCHVLTLTNVTDRLQTVTVPPASLPSDADQWQDLLGPKSAERNDRGLTLSLEPYEILWLEPVDGREECQKASARKPLPGRTGAPPVAE